MTTLYIEKGKTGNYQISNMIKLLLSYMLLSAFVLSCLPESGGISFFQNISDNYSNVHCNNINDIEKQNKFKKSQNFQLEGIVYNKYAKRKNYTEFIRINSISDFKCLINIYPKYQIQNLPKTSYTLQGYISLRLIT
jgi:hypothetical protein